MTTRLMKHFNILLAAAILVCLSACRTSATLPNSHINGSANSQTAIPLILDADFGSSTDDLFALMMLHHYIDEGKVDLRGVIVDREGEQNALLVDVFNNYYGHPQIPIGLERNGVKHPRCFIPYSGICDLTDEQGQLLFQRKVDPSQLPDGYKLYRKLLSQAADRSVVIVAIGFATTLSQLFESTADEYSQLGGRDLFAQKVKAVYIQSGRFEAGDSLSGYNMRAASKQSAIFYSKFPRNVALMMSPSNVGDQINYQPSDVLADLSYTERNPIKSVYTYYTCDTGQRMWDTNCLVQAVLGDKEYNLSPRGWVTFVDRGEESLMLFREDANGNARYQIPGDSYFAESKLMDIRRHNRINRYPAPYTIEAPQPQLTQEAAAQWAQLRLGLLADKYLGSAGNKIDPDDVRMLFKPIGYSGSNPADYQEAEALVVDAIFDRMVQKAIRAGRRDLVIVTGPPASGKTTAVRLMNLKKAGVVYDAELGSTERLATTIARAQQLGMEKVTVVIVYNDIMTCYKNAIDRGHRVWRYTALDYLVNAFRNSQGRLGNIQQRFPDVEIVPVNMAGNSGLNRVSIDEAQQWNYQVNDEELNQLFNYLISEIDNGDIEASLLPSAVGNVEAIPGLNDTNKSLARQIARRVQQIQSEIAAKRQ